LVSKAITVQPHREDVRRAADADEQPAIRANHGWTARSRSRRPGGIRASASEAVQFRLKKLVPEQVHRRDLRMRVDGVRLVLGSTGWPPGTYPNIEASGQAWQA
jgi:hypothetical protein